MNWTKVSYTNIRNRFPDKIYKQAYTHAHPVTELSSLHHAVSLCVPAVSGKCDGGQAVRNRVMHQQQHREWDQHGWVDDHGSPHEAKHKQQHAARTHGRGQTLWAAQHPLTHQNNPISIGSADYTHPSTHRCAWGSADSQCCDIIRSDTQTHPVQTGFAAAAPAVFPFLFSAFPRSFPLLVYRLLIDACLLIKAARCCAAQSFHLLTFSPIHAAVASDWLLIPYASSLLSPQLT